MMFEDYSMAGSEKREIRWDVPVAWCVKGNFSTNFSSTVSSSVSVGQHSYDSVSLT